MDAALKVADRVFASRLLLGTGKYRTHAEMKACHEASGTDMVTVAVRRVDLTGASGPSVLDFVDRSKIALLPNTAGCYTVDDAVRTARLGREALGTDWVKLEVLGDPETLWPDPVGTLEACAQLAREGFVVMAYMADDPILAKRLVDVGVAAVMPAGSPIGSGLGVLNPVNIAMVRDAVAGRVPVIVDAGVGTASDVAVAMELGIDGVLLNTAVALARDPVLMARAMGLACEAGRSAYLAGRIPKSGRASPSSPTTGTITAPPTPRG